MTMRRRVPDSALAALVTAMALSSPAWASERACPAPIIDADTEFVARFPDLLDRIRAELSNRPDLDACARVDLRATDADTIQVSVTLPDGRSATRHTKRRDDVLPTLQALLLVPQASPAVASATPAPSLRTRPRVVRLAPLGPAPRDHDGAVAAVGPRRFGIELSLLGGARVGEGQVAAGVAALSLLEAHGWLLGFVGRVDRYQVPVSGDPEMALELGLLGGKRLHFPSFALDFIAGPAVAMKGLAVSNTEVVRVGPEPVRPPPLPDDPSTGPVPRLLLGAHAGFSPRSIVRSFVGMEASIGPARSDDHPNPGSARFPVFTLGMVLGGTVGTK
jgi:hypothetical protein